MRRHAVIWHAPPGMIGWWRLWEPNVSRIAGEPAAFKSMDDVISITYLGTCGIDKVRAALHLIQNPRVEEMLRRGIKRGMDADNIADLCHLLGSCVVRQA